MATDVNPAYDMSAPGHRAETKGGYEDPQYIQPPSVAAHDEGVYEGID